MSQIITVNSIFITQLLYKIGKPQRIIAILIAALLATLAVVLVACNNGPSQPAQAPSSATVSPSETLLSMNGSTLLDTRCSICHSTDKPKQAKKTREKWEQTVNRMIDKGAKLTDEEKEVLLDYLAKIYGDGGRP